MSLGRKFAADHLRNLLRDELRLKSEQGFSIPPGLADRMAHSSFSELHDIETELESLTEPDHLGTNEPLDWTIPSLALEKWVPNQNELDDRIRGAWYGRIAGCILGKPLEIHPFMREPKLLRQYLERTNQWPLSDFVDANDDVCVEITGQTLGSRPSVRGNIRYAQSDDDLRYTLAGLRILDKIPNPSTRDVFQYWSSHWLPDQTFTAEQAAISNSYAFGRPHHWEQPEDAEYQQAMRQWRNPYREWIGAAIRADGWAYGYAGNPERAAQVAQQDALISHERNGEYSEIFFAAWISASFRLPLHDSFRVALQTVPQNSRLATAMVETKARCDAGGTMDELLDYIEVTSGHYDGVHSINNALACVASVFLSNGDLELSITRAVMFGLDTDCNGATVGSIVGARVGASGFPVEKWINPFDDTIDFEFVGEERQSINGLASWTVELWRRLNQ
ncbi:MAG: ADP-ribosylglycohydrolase family protein [Armatimonadota bacterium]